MTDKFVEWSPLFEIGIPKIDEQHKSLAALVNEFHAIAASQASRDKVFSVLNRLVKYVEEHFRDEEELMGAANYPELMKQKMEHQKLAVDIFKFAERYGHNESELNSDVMDFLKTWLIDHILHEDKKLETFFRGKPLPTGW